MKTFRDAIRKASPPWLRRGNAEKVLYAVGVHLDGLIDAMVASIKMRFPGYYSDETLPFESRQRGIFRGREETSASFAARLIGWWDAHRRRGNPYELLRQLHAHFAPNNFPIELIYASGRRFTLAPDGTITWDDVAWTPPGDPAKHARWWLFYHNPAFAVAPGEWNDGVTTWNGGQVWGSGLSAADVFDLKLIPIAWGNAESIGHLVLLDEGEAWDTYEPGAWPRQIALEAMTDPLVPVDDFDIDTVIPPENGQPVLAEVVTSALQKAVNALLNLKNRADQAKTRAETSARYATAAVGSPAVWATEVLTSDGWSVEGDPATDIQVPAAGRYLVAWSGLAQSSDADNPIWLRVNLLVGGNIEAQALVWRYSAEVSELMYAAGTAVVEITDPATQRISVTATATDNNAPTSATLNNARISLARLS